MQYTQQAVYTTGSLIVTIKNNSCILSGCSKLTVPRGQIPNFDCKVAWNHSNVHV